MISIVTYNILLGRKLKKISTWIAQFLDLPDIVCFQEFPSRAIEKVLPFFEELGYGYVFAAEGELKKKHCTVLTLYKRATITLLESKSIPLGYTRLEKAIFQSIHQRYALMTRFSAHGKPVVICNTHLSLIAPHSKRREQLSQIVKEVNGNQSSIILGDFNYTSLVKQRSLFEFMDQHQYQNAAQKAITHRLWFFYQQLDYIFYKNVKLQDMFVLHAPFSDHLPLFARFQLP